MPVTSEPMIRRTGMRIDEPTAAGATLIFDSGAGGVPSIEGGAPGPFGSGPAGGAAFIWDNTFKRTVLNPNGNQPYYSVGFDLKCQHAEGLE